MVREKTIEHMELVPLDVENNKTKRICVNLQTSAGTYVKEFMHGDEGRTVPSIGDFLECGKVVVESLDVTKVFLEWPPRITSKIEE